MKIEIRPPYMLVLESTNWTGNFERGIIGYSMGILDDTQMDIDFADKERDQFWTDMLTANADRGLFPFDRAPLYQEAVEEYPLMKDFLLETYQSVDDWEQSTFYKVGRSPKGVSYLNVQLTKPLSQVYESIVIGRMIRYCRENNIDLASLELLGPAHDQKEGQVYHGEYRIEKKYV